MIDWLIDWLIESIDCDGGCRTDRSRMRVAGSRGDESSQSQRDCNRRIGRAQSSDVASDANKDWTCKDKNKDKDKDQAYKDQNKEKD